MEQTVMSTWEVFIWLLFPALAGGMLTALYYEWKNGTF
jgi:hypothetical protein